MTTRYADHVLSGTTAARPAATSVPVGTLYASSTDGVVYQSSGSAWGTWLAAPAAGVPIGVVDVKGDLIAASGPDAVARLPVGSNNQVLTADSAQTLGVKWATPATSPGVAADTIWDTKGDLAVATAADTAAKLAVGSNGQVLTADSAQTAGVKWATPSSGGGGSSEIAYAEITSAVSITATGSGSANTIVTAPAVTVSGTQKIKIDFYSPNIRLGATGAAAVAIVLFEDGTALAELMSMQLGTASSGQAWMPVYLSRLLTPSAGSRTYSIRAWRNDSDGLVVAGNGTSGNRAPAFIRIVTA